MNLRPALLLALLPLSFSAVGAAPPALLSTAPFDECGELIQGVTCPLLFESDSGLVLVLDDYGSFQLGDRVRVTGDYDPGCFSSCNQGDGCIFGTTITDCSQQDLGSSYCGPANTNSSGQSAVISAFGSLDVSLNDVRLDAAQMPVNQFGMFLNSMSQGFTQPPGSQGNLCLGGAIGRYNKNLQNTGSTGEFSLQLDLTNTPTPSGPVAIQPGETWYFQAWFRDNNPSSTSNFTDGLEIQFQ